MPLKSVAADANVILSAIAGKAALRVFLHAGLEIVTARFNLDEVEEYLEVMAEQYGLQAEILESQLRLLPLKICLSDYYEDLLPEAARRLAGRDDDDIELLALALKLNIPVWSNDNDFKKTGIEVYTTAKLIKALKA